MGSSFSRLGLLDDEKRVALGTREGPSGNALPFLLFACRVLYPYSGSSTERSSRTTCQAPVIRLEAVTSRKASSTRRADAMSASPAAETPSALPESRTICSYRLALSAKAD